MPRMKLTAAAVERIKPPKTGRVEYWDTLLPGLGLRVTDKGNKSWTLLYRVHGKQRRLTPGRYPLLGLADARQAARDALQKVEMNIDPAEVKAEAVSDNSFAAIVDDFIKRHAQQKNKTWLQTQNMFAKKVTPLWGHRPIDSITRQDVIQLLDGIIDQKKPYAANRMLSAVRRLFNWCIERGILETSPADRIKPPGKEVSRKKVVGNDEIKKLWAAWDQLDYPFGSIFKLLLLTAQRKGEVTSMRWTDIDREEEIWTLPSEFTKSGREHKVPLSPFALEVLDGLPRFESDYVFPSRSNPDQFVSGLSKPKKRACEISGVEDWRLHDLRRTAASNITARIGLAGRHFVSMVLNHAESGVTHIYDQYSYLPEKRQALDAWSEGLKEILESEPAIGEPAAPKYGES